MECRDRSLCIREVFKEMLNKVSNVIKEEKQIYIIVLNINKSYLGMYNQIHKKNCTEFKALNEDNGRALRSTSYQPDLSSRDRPQGTSPLPIMSVRQWTSKDVRIEPSTILILSRVPARERQVKRRWTIPSSYRCQGQRQVFARG